MSKKFHLCEIRADYKLTQCYEDLNRRLIITQITGDPHEQTEPDQVNICPFCGFKAKVKRKQKVKSRSVKKQRTVKLRKQALKPKRKRKRM